MMGLQRETLAAFRRSFRKMSMGERVLQVIIVFGALLNLFPLYWLISNTFKYSSDVSKMPPDWIPKNFTLQNYISIFTTTNAFRWLFNSVVVAFVGTCVVVLVSALASYGFSKLKFTGNTFLFAFFVGTLMVPKESYIVPLFSMMSSMKMTNTYASMILPVVAMPFGVFMLKSFFDGIPDAMRESAKMDGAPELTVFYKVFLPMAKPGLSALFILMFVRFWNDYLWQLLMAKTDVMKTMMVGIASLMVDNRPDIARKLTGAACSAIPMLIVFISFQKYFTRGISVGAVKG